MTKSSKSIFRGKVKNHQCEFETPIQEIKFYRFQLGIKGENQLFTFLKLCQRTLSLMSERSKTYKEGWTTKSSGTKI